MAQHIFDLTDQQEKDFQEAFSLDLDSFVNKQIKSCSINSAKVQLRSFLDKLESQELETLKTNLGPIQDLITSTSEKLFPPPLPVIDTPPPPEPPVEEPPTL